MTATVEPACLTFDTNGIPVSEEFGDVYHSADGGHAQARHVFLAGNGLPERWRDQDEFTILETGFGLGLNFLATWLTWLSDPQACKQLHFISLEKFPFLPADLAVAHAGWPEFAPFSAELCQKWPPLQAGEHQLELADGQLRLSLVFGDALEQLPRLRAEVDAFYLDGFSPARNPELWSPAVCQALGRLARPGATLATWSVAGRVRQALASAGFALEKRQGFGAKRQMLVGRFAAGESAIRTR